MELKEEKEMDYEQKLSTVRSEMSWARWWQERSPERRLDFAKMAAEEDYAAEVQIAKEFGKEPEPIAKKIERYFARYDALAKKYPIEIAKKHQISSTPEVQPAADYGAGK